MLLILSLAAWGRRAQGATAALVIAAFSVSALGADLRAQSHLNEEVSALLGGTLIDIRAVATGDPRALRDRVVGQQRWSGRTLLLVRVERISADGSAIQVRFAATLLSSVGMGQVIPGECLTFAARGGRFDDGRPILRVDTPIARCGSASAVQRGAAAVREGLRNASVRLPADARGLLPGLVVGDTSHVTPSLEQAMRDVNLAHLTAVSGANLAIVAGFILLIGRGVGVRREILPVVVAVSLIFFVVLARPDPSVLRAAVMAMVLLAARMLGSTHAAFSALAFAVLILILANPAQAGNPGFVLSVSATAGLILWVRPLSGRLERWLPRPLAIGLAVPIAAQLACTPFLVAYSGQLSLIGIITNFGAAPLVAPATILGLIAGLVALGSVELASLIGLIAGAPVMVIAWIARAGSDLPFASLPMPIGLTGGLLVIAMTVATVIGVRRWKGRTVIGLVAAALAVFGLSYLEPGWPMREWQLAACDVGQGDGLVLRVGESEAVVVDVGPSGKVFLECLGRLRIDRIPLLVITHAHADHMEGLAEVLTAVAVDEVLLPRAAEPVEQYERLLEMTQGVPRREVRFGESFEWSDARVQVLWPSALVEAGSVANNSSTVLLADLAGLRILLLADVEREAQAALPPIAGIDIIKVAHHGSANQELELMDRWRPNLGVISVGAGNPYGHPAPSLLNAFANRGIALYRTDRAGSLAFSTADGAIVVRPRGRPFWARR